eukprot:754316-Hanusia_phi.AAC.1
MSLGRNGSMSESTFGSRRQGERWHARAGGEERRGEERRGGERSGQLVHGLPLPRYPVLLRFQPADVEETGVEEGCVPPGHDLRKALTQPRSLEEVFSKPSPPTRSPLTTKREEREQAVMIPKNLIPASFSERAASASSSASGGVGGQEQEQEQEQLSSRSSPDLCAGNEIHSSRQQHLSMLRTELDMLVPCLRVCQDGGIDVLSDIAKLMRWCRSTAKTRCRRAGVMKYQR